jgi:hypothetical protein
MIMSLRDHMLMKMSDSTQWMNTRNTPNEYYEPVAERYQPRLEWSCYTRPDTRSPNVLPSTAPDHQPGSISKPKLPQWRRPNSITSFPPAYVPDQLSDTIEKGKRR